LILTLIPAALFVTLDALATSSQARAEADAELQRITVLAADAYGRQIDEAERILSIIALYPQLRSGDAAECSARLAEIAARLQPRQGGFAVSDLQGNMFCASVPLTATVQIADRHWFQDTVRTQQFAIGEYTLSRPLGIPTVGVGYPLFDEQGRLVRVLSHSLRLSHLQEEAGNLPLPTDAILTITDRNGVILARTPGGEEYVGQPQAAAALRQRIEYGGEVVEAVGVDGVQRLYAFAPVRGPSGEEVWLSIGRTPDVVYETVRQASLRNVLGVGSILLAALAAVWIGSNYLLLRKIKRLSQASERLAAGDLQARAPIGSSGDELDRLAITVNNMAEALLQRQAEALERERQLHLALQAARMVAWTWDPLRDRVITTENFAEIYGLNAVNLASEGFALLHPDDRERHMQIVAEATAARSAYHSEFRVIRPDNGETVWLDERGVFALNAQGEEMLCGVVMDITERKRAQQALQEAHLNLEARVALRTAELERSNRDLNQFAYVASHDLKAPLRAIDNLAAWISQDAAALLPPPSAEHLAKLRGRVRRMEQLLDDLLAYSRAGRVRPPAEWVDVAEMVQDVTGILAPPDGFVILVEGSIPLLHTPRASLELVLRNLLGNAIKHHGGERGCVVVRAEVEGEMVRIFVTDDGRGIDESFHDRIFEMFQTLQPRDEVEGSGMGLAIVKKLVESYGGSIGVESARGEGATFYFTWPLAAGG
jgi:PAS domain S-box-containing protein